MKTNVSHPEAKLIDQLAAGFAETVRMVRFSGVDEFLEELKLQRETLAIPYIRCTALFRWDAQVTIMQHVTAAAGFWGQHEYVELRKYLGQRMSGDDGECGKRYDVIRDEILRTCAELGIEVRGGYYCNQGEGGKHA